VALNILRTSTIHACIEVICRKKAVVHLEALMNSAAIEIRSGAVSRNPSTGELIETYPYQTPQEAGRTLAANAEAFQVWRSTPMVERVGCYRRLATTLRSRSEPLARLITSEMGKTIGETRREVEKCALALEWFAEHGPAFLVDEPVAVENGDCVYVSFLPIGTVLAVMPWNFPFWQVIRAAAPIMLSGNGLLLKHASNVMGCAYALRDAYEASGFPRHLFANLNVSNATVDGMIPDPRIAAVTVTGSNRAGSAVASAAGRAMKKSLLELGGSDPFIVLADADIDKAVEVGIEARFQNAGQVCLAAKRFILERPIADEFARKFVSAAARIKTGDPLDETTAIGPVAREDLREGVHDQVRRSIASGATLLLGGKAVDGPGYFYEPTVLGDVAPGMAAFDEEVFGPVAALTIADDLEHAIALANTSEYGLSGNLWTSDTNKARGIASRLETGGVFINGFSASNPRLPVGGVKKSGYGRELSHFGLREFTNAQGVWVKNTPERRA
jgi:succinate-semialdehyde dehydrogenase